MPQLGGRSINRGSAAAAVFATLVLVLYLATNPGATPAAAGFLGGLVAAGLLGAALPSPLLRVALLAAIAGSSLAFGAFTPSWLGLALALISMTAVAGLVEAASRQALRVAEWFGIGIGALAGIAGVAVMFWLVSG